MNKKNIAFLYHYEKIAAAMFDHIESFGIYSKHNIHYYDMRRDSLCLDDLNKFDCIVIHYSLTVMSDYTFPSSLRLIIRSCCAKKFMFMQDEYRLINKAVEAISYLKIDVLFTLVPEYEWENVYPKSLLPNLRLVNTMAGYVPENLLKIKRRVYSEREYDVVYRARTLSAWYGRLAKHKWQIAENFNRSNDVYGLKADVSADSKDRLYGQQWIDFLLNSKAILGCETGASVSDFTGSIQKNVEAFEAKNPHADFELLECLFFAGHDGRIAHNQISPRCFESACLGVLMVLYEGDYSGILKPWVHYVPLKYDHSNMSEVAETIRDESAWTKIVDCAYQDIAVSGLFSYKSFVEKFDSEVDKYDTCMAVKFNDKRSTNEIHVSPQLHDDFYTKRKRFDRFLYTVSCYTPDVIKSNAKIKNAAKKVIHVCKFISLMISFVNGRNYQLFFWHLHLMFSSKFEGFHNFYLIMNYLFSVNNIYCGKVFLLEVSLLGKCANFNIVLAYDCNDVCDLTEKDIVNYLSNCDYVCVNFPSDMSIDKFFRGKFFVLSDYFLWRHVFEGTRFAITNCFKAINLL